jgi:hypothetical protein
MAGPSASTSVLRQQLRQAVFDCRERGLNEAAAWAAQQLNGLPKVETTETTTTLQSKSDDNESDIYLYAKSLFDSKVSNTCCLR